MFQTKLYLHSFHWMRFHDKFNIFLEVVFNNFEFHLLFVIGIFTAFFISFFITFWLLIFSGFLCRLLFSIFRNSFLFLVEMNILDIPSRGWFFRKIAFCYTYRSDKFDIEILSKNDIIFKAGLNLEVFFIFFTYITKLQHTISYFFVE